MKVTIEKYNQLSDSGILTDEELSQIEIIKNIKLEVDINKEDVPKLLKLDNFNRNTHEDTCFWNIYKEKGHIERYVIGLGFNKFDTAVRFVEPFYDFK